jgi:hypothetical protein
VALDAGALDVKDTDKELSLKCLERSKEKSRTMGLST